MKLSKKVFIIVCILCMVMVTYPFVVEDIYIDYADNPLKRPVGINLFDNITPYIIDVHNAITTKAELSTGMYTDANYINFYVILAIPPDDSLLLKAWDDNQAYIAFESTLQGTKEWISNNKYIISMYYYPHDNAEENPISIFHEKWVGLDRRVSSSVPIPEEAKECSIYIRYSSDIGSIFMVKNGNDIRFFNNYLSVY